MQYMLTQTAAAAGVLSQRPPLHYVTEARHFAPNKSIFILVRYS